MIEGLGFTGLLKWRNSDGPKWLADSWADWRYGRPKDSGRELVNFTIFEDFLCERLEMIVDIPIKVGCHKATNGWLENPLVDDILMVDKRKEKVPAGKNILLKLKKKNSQSFLQRSISYKIWYLRWILFAFAQNFLEPNWKIISLSSSYLDFVLPWENVNSICKTA